MPSEQNQAVPNHDLTQKIPPWLKAIKFNNALTDDEIKILEGDRDFISPTVLEKVGIDRFIICTLLAEGISAEDMLQLLKSALKSVTNGICKRTHTLTHLLFFHPATKNISVNTGLNASSKIKPIGAMKIAPTIMDIAFEIICPFAMALANLKVLDILKGYIPIESFKKHLTSDLVKIAVIYRLNCNHDDDFFDYSWQNSNTSSIRVRDILLSSGTKEYQMLVIKARDMCKTKQLYNAINKMNFVNSVASQYQHPTPSPSSCDASYGSINCGSSLRQTPKNKEIEILHTKNRSFL